MIDLSPEQIALLTTVRLSPGAPIARAARLSQMTPTTARNMVDYLAALGLIERRNHADHPNANELHLTDAGVSELSEHDVK